jgi:hypothetical protein
MEDYKSLNKAMNDLDFYCRRIGRVGGTLKEKYGSIRFYVDFGPLSLHNLIYPGYHYRQFGPKLYRIDERLETVFKYTGLNTLFVLWQKFWYKAGYRIALRRYPHIRLEIAASADYPELFAHKIVVWVNEKGNRVTTYYDRERNVLSRLISRS